METIGKKEARIIVGEIECSLGSILYYKSRDKKGEFTFDNFEKFNINDFVLEHAEMTESEFKTCIKLLGKCKKILKQADKTQSQKESKR